MRIDEREGRVGGERDTLAGWRQGDRTCHGWSEWGRARDDGVEIEMLRSHRSEALEPRSEVGMLTGLYQAEMALGQRQCDVARDGADDRHAERCNGIGHQRAMALAA